MPATDMAGLSEQVIGAHLWIATDGTKTAPATTWLSVGPCESISVEPQTQVHEWMVPMPACRRRTGVVNWQSALNFRATILYGSAALWKFLFMGDPALLDATTHDAATTPAFSPLKFPNDAAGGPYAWCQLQYYGCHSDVDPLLTVQLFCHLMIETAPELGTGPVQYELMGRQVHSDIQSTNSVLAV